MAKKHSVGRFVAYFIVVCLLIILTAAGGAYLYMRHLLDGMERTSITKDEEALGITDQTKSSSEVVNIALFGVDTRDMSGDSGRSDAMIILSIDKAHKKIKLTSLARDTRVEIEGYGNEKLCHAYAYGGPELAIQTINRSFGLDIRDYVTVNFEQLEEIIDYLGGVIVNVDQDEANELERMGVGPVTQTGDIRLTGAQAVAYARNRTTGSDVDRQSRQREVLMSLYSEARSKSLIEYPGILEQVLKMCETTLSSDVLMELGMWAVVNNPAMEQFALPILTVAPTEELWRMEPGILYMIWIWLPISFMSFFIMMFSRPLEWV